MSQTDKHPSRLPTSPTRLRQIALVAEDLARARYLLTKVIGTEVIYTDHHVAQWGLKNILGIPVPAMHKSPANGNATVAIGGDVIEVVSPMRPNTTAGRLLSKRGDGGYMIIMQTSDAAARRSYLETQGLAKVIFSYEGDDFVCVQYHPKSIKGGMMPELDSHIPSPTNLDPLTSSFSPWHACGADYNSYSAGMRRCANLQLVSVVCRLAPGDTDTEAAARQWEELFGVPGEGNELAFTNMRMKFIKGEKDKPDGLESITIAVEGEQRFNAILEAAREEGLCGDGWINMLGVKWYFTLVGDSKSKL